MRLSVHVCLLREACPEAWPVGLRCPDNRRSWSLQDSAEPFKPCGSQQRSKDSCPGPISFSFFSTYIIFYHSFAHFAKAYFSLYTHCVAQ